MSENSPYYYQAELCGRRGKNGKLRDPIVDGDTVDVLCHLKEVADLGYDIRIGMRLRLGGIDTPESRTRNLQEKAKGKKAKEFLKDALGSAESLSFVSYDRGKYGRVLASLFAVIDGEMTDVNALMVEQGHARWYDGGKREPWT